MAKIKLAEALLRRKELNEKVEVLKRFKTSDLMEIKVTRKGAHEGIDDIVAQVPKLTASQVTAEYDFYARALRHTDASIQQANWTCEVDIPDTALSDFQK